MFTFPFHIYIEGYGVGATVFCKQALEKCLPNALFSFPEGVEPLYKSAQGAQSSYKVKHEAIRGHVSSKNGGVTVVGPVSISPTLFSLVLRYFSDGKVPKYSGRCLLTLLIGQCPKLYIFSHCFLAC